MRFYIDRVIRIGTRNAVVQLDSGAILKVDCDQAKPHTFLDVEGNVDSWFSTHSISAPYYRRLTKDDSPPQMLKSFLY